MGIRDIPFPPWRKKLGFKSYQPHETLFLEQWQIPAGTDLKITTTRDHGIVVLPEGTKDVRGFVIPRRIFRY